MMSFMRERNKGKSNPADGNISLPAAQSADQGNEERYLTVSDKKTRKGTIILVILFAAGLLCLILMIRKSSPSAVSAGTVAVEEAKLENAISRLTGVNNEIYDRMDEIMKKFYEFSNVNQVNVAELV